jgi:flagellar biosynthesis/type III secretory pathway protein FliH
MSGVLKLQLDPARRELISGFVDAYLQLTMEQEYLFESAIQQMHPGEKEGVMEIVTSWMERGLEKGLELGRQEGRQEGERRVIVRQLRKRLGQLDHQTEDRINALSADRLEELEEALLDFARHADLHAWLERHP